MTIIIEPARDTRAEQRINPPVRLHGGPLPHGKPNAFPIDLKNQKDQGNTEQSRLQ